jgi:hypothetical protein
MNLNEITNLTDDELGKALAIAAGLQIGMNGFKNFYLASRVWTRFERLPNDLNKIAEIEAIVIEKVGKYEYGEALIEVAGMLGSHRSGWSVNGICEIATMGARQRATACLLALQD